MKQVVAEPQVAARVVESDFKLRPRTVKEIRSVDVLLNQQRNAGRYATNKKCDTLKKAVHKPTMA